MSDDTSPPPEGAQESEILITPVLGTQAPAEDIPITSSEPAQGVPRESSPESTATAVAPTLNGSEDHTSSAPAAVPDANIMAAVQPTPPSIDSEREKMAHVHELTADDRKRGNAKRLQHREEDLDKIIALARIRHFTINDDVEKLLHCSDATASRYLHLLVSRGRLMREGEGRGAKYKMV